VRPGAVSSRPAEQEPGLGAAPQVLFVSPVVPAPLDRGQNVRIHNVVMGLARHFRVTLVVPHAPESDVESPLWAAVEQVVTVPPAAGRATLRDVVRFMVRHRTVVRPGVVTWLTPFAEAVDRLDLDHYSVIWVERLGLARLFAPVAARVVVDMDDLEHRKWARELRLHARAGLGPDSLKRFYYAVRFFVHEVVLARRYRYCTVASATDAAYLRRWGLRSSALLPNGATVTEPAARTPRGEGAPGRVVFLGNLGYGPNVDAVAHFEESVRPILDKRGLARRPGGHRTGGDGGTPGTVPTRPLSGLRPRPPGRATGLRVVCGAAAPRWRDQAQGPRRHGGRPAARDDIRRRRGPAPDRRCSRPGRRFPG